MSIVEVKFDYCMDNSYFKNDVDNVRDNLTVIVSTDKGLKFGKVVRVINDISSFEKLCSGDVVRISSKKDYLHHLDNLKLGNEAISKCKEYVLKDKLNMNIIDGYYNFDRSQLLFRFVSDERVDFRNLAKELGAAFKTRIELRQIGIRDKAKEIGGIGPCGRLLCCSSFLKTFDSITINMAKNQNLSLNPTKINGVCGRLLCCLKYENDIYSQLKSNLPKIGSKIEIDHHTGKVISVDILGGKYVVELDDGDRVEMDLNDIKK